MAQLIDKNALAAEIENIRKHYIEKEEFDIGWNFALDKILSFINTLEVEEVDLEKEIKKSVYNCFSTYATVDDMVYIAKHFFELGLKTQKKE